MFARALRLVRLLRQAEMIVPAVRPGSLEAVGASLVCIEQWANKLYRCSPAGCQSLLDQVQVLREEFSRLRVRISNQDALLENKRACLEQALQDREQCARSITELVKLLSEEAEKRLKAESALEQLSKVHA